jgi:hypothetical protein
MRPTHDAIDERLKPHVLNLWFSRFFTQHPLLADDCYRAGVGSDVAWDRMFLFGAVRTDRSKKLRGDCFGSGFEGQNIGEQITNGARAWANVKDVEELSGTDEATLQAYDALLAKWLGYRKLLLEQLSEKPLPEPPKPEPVKPPPTPIPLPPQEPAKPDESGSKPAKPDESGSKPAKPDESGSKPAKPGWKKTAAMVAGVLGGGMFLIKLFAPAYVVMALEFLQKILALIGG